MFNCMIYDDTDNESLNEMTAEVFLFRSAVLLLLLGKYIQIH